MKKLIYIYIYIIIYKYTNKKNIYKSKYKTNILNHFQMRFEAPLPQIPTRVLPTLLLYSGGVLRQDNFQSSYESK